MFTSEKINSNSMKNQITEDGGFKKKRASSGENLRPANEEYSFTVGSRLSMDRNSFNNNSNPIWDHSGPATLDQTSSSGGLTDTLSPMSKSPWSSTHVSTAGGGGTGTEEQKQNSNYDYTGLMGSLIREEGHIYSLAASGELLYTGSDSKNIRVWKNQKEFAGFKSNSGLVKAIIISGDKIFTGHQDGKIRVWKVFSKTSTVHKRVGTLPSLKVYFKDSLRPCNYSRSGWTKHADAISCLSLSSDKNFLYSASWDRTIKVWRVSNSKCVESIDAHEDSVNAVVSGFDGLVFSGSADGTVKAWRIELEGKGTKHHFSQTLLKQECAVTALAVELSGNVLYCGTSDGNINFWERDNHLAHGGVLWGHKLAVLSLATAKDMVFSGSSDTNICVWKKEGTSHICLTVLSGHSGPVKCLAVQEHGGSKTTQGKDTTEDKHWILYSGSLDKSVKIWKVSSASKNQMPQPEFRTETFPSLHSFSSRGSRVCQMRPC